MSFQHVPLREIKASGGSFSGTYRYVSSSIARPRAALLRRASVGNFEIVEKRADKKSKTVRFRIEKVVASGVHLLTATRKLAAGRQKNGIEMP